ncbi:type ISP restriction/modification enzyme [Apilactobacillus xinyiensis]|uniref:type ISP restriction/modification enzyme n=1 Tax=Apilactobacillus xinyiensis TaxID=2841032 RepID=UPI001C7CF3F8|nr:type ISP restriction/modification enzyme [Apilactobacillus xinyiensis]
MATFKELINQIDSTMNNQRDRGTAFEEMVVSYLKNEPLYKQKYKNVWMLKDVPEQYHIPKKDTGVDIVAESYDGKLTAVQAKYYRGKIGKDTINSFVAEAGKEYYYDGLIVSTTDEWNKNAENALENNSKSFARIGLSQLSHANINWQMFSFGDSNKDLSIKKPKELRKYQKEAIDNSLKYFKNNNRGKLIMAPGTGKTFTSLKIAESLMNEQKRKNFYVLYLVPSIQLLSQTLFNWNDDKSDSLHMTSFSVVSDRKANKKSYGKDDLGAKDIGFPATTNVDELINNFNNIKNLNLNNNMTVVFSTYQSIDVIKEAQKNGYPEFDLIIADEAHRTTGATKLNEDSVFTEVHSDTNVKGKLRLYQTATPKLYDANAKKKAKENSILVSSMDDEDKYGKEIFRLGFGDAVAQGYLTDYKVTVLAVNESYINKDMQKLMAADNQLKVDDIGKIIGVWNAMVKRDGITGEIKGAPMKRAIAFTDTIKHSKIISNEFETVVNEYLDAKATGSFQVDVHHVDGGLNALQKKDEIDWLGDNNIQENHSRVLSNVRFLTEGIDVPNLDGIIFFSPKKSQVDIVQAVGRIMRRAENKEYGYIILPIVVSDGVDPHAALDNDSKYKEIWQVLNALRSIDERFDAEVNKLDLNKNKSKKIDLIGVNSSPDNKVDESTSKNEEQNTKQMELPLNFQEMRNAFYGKVVQHVGDRRYLEDWSKDVSDIAKRHIRKINDLIDSNDGAKMAFENFHTSLKHNINDSISREQTVEMLAQHLITEPVFDALFGEYSFVKNNVVSKSMNDVISAFKVFGFSKEQEDLKPFYDSIKLRASGIDNAEGKQKLILSLYDNFFKKGFKETTEQLGIVFTPTEVVDFIIHSVDDAMHKYFGKGLADKGVHILDPFTGTGTFITRTLQYLKQEMDAEKITFDDILYKYMHELHANEIVLLSYYIAAINIESVFDEVNGPDRGYKPFNGIVLTDTFESTERKDSFMDELLGQNNERLKKQQENPITVIMSNPPYFAKQSNEDDNQTKSKYELLDNSIEKSYSKLSSAQNKNGLTDSYIRALRWASNRISNNGVIGFITNNSFINSSSADGIRKSLINEFSDIYIINLKGKSRGLTSLQAKKEGKNIFNIRVGVAITILVKKQSNDYSGKLHYLDIDNYLNKSEKLKKIQKWHSIFKIDNKLKKIIPNHKGDWINQRNTNFDQFVKIGSKKENNTLFNDYTGGITTGRDNWSWGFSKKSVENKITESINYYNDNLGNIEVYNKKTSKISWNKSLKKLFESKKHINYDSSRIYLGMYRPFTKKYAYYEADMIDRQYQMSKVLPKSNSKNLMLSMPNKAHNFKFTTLIINVLPDRNIFSGGSQNFPKKMYDNIGSYSSINFSILKNKYRISEDEIIYYVYGLLHSKDYINMYDKDLSKSLPRIPLVKNKEKYIEIGKKLSYLHLNYENIPTYKKLYIKNNDKNYIVNKMKFDKVKDKNGKLVRDKKGNSIKDKSTIIFNDDITISNIPSKAYEYVVNGKSAIEWIMDQYQFKTDKKSGITDDPNEYSDDPKYIFNLLLRIINVSVQTVDLVNQLPKFEVDE